MADHVCNAYFMPSVEYFSFEKLKLSPKVAGSTILGNFKIYLIKKSYSWLNIDKLITIIFQKFTILISNFIKDIVWV